MGGPDPRARRRRDARAPRRAAPADDLRRRRLRRGPGQPRDRAALHLRSRHRAPGPAGAALRRSGRVAVFEAIWSALALSFAMTWEITWALIVGFTLSAVVQAVVSKSQMSRLLPDDSPRSIAVACGLGAASSSCSYAAVALARSLFQKGAHFTAAMAFEFASTNLVIELGIIMAILLGWQFTLAEFAGGPLMIAILVLLFRLFLRRPLLESARRQAERGLRRSMEGHAAMDMSVTEGGNVLERALSPLGFTAISHYFVMDWAAIWKDIAGGLLIAGALGALVPVEFWRAFFLSGDPRVAALWGPVVGPLVSLASFVSSIA